MLKLKWLRKIGFQAAFIPVLVASLLAASQARPEDAPAKKPVDQTNAEKLAAKRLEFMKSSVKSYEFSVGPDFKEKLTVETEPLLRFTNPVSGLQDGGFVVWKTEAGRPMVAAQVFLTSEDLWLHEFQSLSPTPLKMVQTGKALWEPNRAGVEVKVVPDAPKPATNPVQRLTQMRDIAKRFTASDKFEGRPQSDELRLLTKPLVRFGANNTDILDGALFVHAHGTDPELMIVIEALKKSTDSDHRWYYSLAPMTGYALNASLDGKPVWEVAWRQQPNDPKEPFFIRVHSKELSLKRLFDFGN